VLTPSFRYNPAVLAQQFATLALLNPDRVVLGVGTGEALNEMSVGLRSGRSSRSASPGSARPSA
jgi:coenzyme F420-dependent glucose-6-phosphate dehydrogenase